MKARFYHLIHNKLLFFIIISQVVLISMITVLIRFDRYGSATKMFSLSLDRLNQTLDIYEHQSKTLKLPILVYHYIEIVTDTRDTIRQSLSITPATFESQLLVLLAHGYHPVTLKQVSDYFEKGVTLPDNPVILSFDDGYRDFYTDVIPIITHFQIPVVLYLTNGFLDSTHNYLTIQQIMEINRNELVEISSHSVNHLNLNVLTTDAARKEILGSKLTLEKLLNKKVDHFAYPYGSYTSDIIKIVREAGFKTAATTDFGTKQTYTRRYELKRIRPGSLTGLALLQFLQQN